MGGLVTVRALSPDLGHKKKMGVWILLAVHSVLLFATLSLIATVCGGKK